MRGERKNKNKTGSAFLQMFQSNLNWDRVPTKIKRAIEFSLEHLDEQKFTLNDTNTEIIDDYSWDLICCYLKKVLQMNLANNKLLKVPPKISSLPHLNTLNLTNNHIEFLPTSIVALSHLRILKVGFNNLTTLPEHISALKSLEILDLTGNQLTERSLKRDFFQLKNLRALYLGDNQFETFPSENLENLENLQILVLRHNRLRFLPKELSNLSQLRELHIQQNQIQFLPPAFGKFDLTNVKHIYRFEPNPFVKELAMEMTHPTRLTNYLTSEIYRELYQKNFIETNDEKNFSTNSKSTQ